MTETPAPGASPPPAGEGRTRRTLLPIAMRYRLVRRALGIQVVYRTAGGGLIVGGLAYAALFALIPTLILVIAGVFLLVDDPGFRQQAIDLLSDAFPAFSDMTDTAVERARELAAVGSIVALVGFAWGASGLYLNLTRAMERFFPGERVSGMLARVLGIVVVVLIIVGVVAAVVMAGVVTVIAEALRLDTRWVMTAISIATTLVLASAIVYAIYRFVPADPPVPSSARLPAILVGAGIAVMTLLYSVLSPWLVSGFQMFGVMASVFIALVWLRVTFLAMVYGAAMARYSEYILAARSLGHAQPDAIATQHALDEERRRAEHDRETIEALERMRAAERARDAGSDRPA